MMPAFGALPTVLALLGAWLALGAAGLLALERQVFVARVLFPLGAVLGTALAVCAAAALKAPPQSLVLPLGPPGLPLSVRLDGLAALFLLLLGGVSAGVSCFAAGYFARREGAPPGLICLAYHLFLAAMALVLLVDDAYSFMLAWETMALASFFLVIANDRDAETRGAAFLYLLVAHVGAVALLGCFAVLADAGGGLGFAAMRAQPPVGGAATLAFSLALIGFGAKAGLLPLHGWLPEAHPAAPSPVSALMSAVMLKTALYGMLRVGLDLLGAPAAGWGVALLAIGLGSALYGVIYAAVQVDMKRLLAYSSIENLGLMFAGVGLAMVFEAHGKPSFAALALSAVLFQALAHALFKSLLFSATGAVLHATGERNLGRLGGLIRYMPQVAWLSLVGALTSAGLPPLAGFIAEWLLLQGFLFTPELPDSFLNMLIPVAAALVALIAALASYTMVKFFGVVFLGRPREPALTGAHDASLPERLGLAWLALGCIALGLQPLPLLRALDDITRMLGAEGLGATLGQHAWLVAPVAVERASYAPLLVLLGVGAVFALSFLGVRQLFHGRTRRAAPWDCGFPLQTARMQDTAEGFGMPIRQIFEPFFHLRRELPTAFDRAPRYHVTVEDRAWRALSLPVARGVEACTRLVARLQQGRIALYLLYSFATLIALLLVTMP